MSWASQQSTGIGLQAGRVPMRAGRHRSRMIFGRQREQRLSLLHFDDVLAGVTHLADVPDHLVHAAPDLAAAALDPAVAKGDVLAVVNAVIAGNALEALQHASLHSKSGIIRIGLLDPELRK